MPLFIPDWADPDILKDKYVSFNDLTAYTSYYNSAYGKTLPDSSDRLVIKSKRPSDYVLNSKSDRWNSNTTIGITWGDTHEFNPDVYLSYLAFDVENNSNDRIIYISNGVRLEGEDAFNAIMVQGTRTSFTTQIKINNDDYRIPINWNNNTKRWTWTVWNGNTLLGNGNQSTQNVVTLDGNASAVKNVPIETISCNGSLIFYSNDFPSNYEINAYFQVKLVFFDKSMEIDLPNYQDLFRLDYEFLSYVWHYAKKVSTFDKTLISSLLDGDKVCDRNLTLSLTGDIKDLASRADIGLGVYLIPYITISDGSVSPTRINTTINVPYIIDFVSAVRENPTIIFEAIDDDTNTVIASKTITTTGLTGLHNTGTTTLTIPRTALTDYVRIEARINSYAHEMGATLRNEGAQDDSDTISKIYTGPDNVLYYWTTSAGTRQPALITSMTFDGTWGNQSGSYTPRSGVSQSKKLGPLVVANGIQPGYVSTFNVAVATHFKWVRWHNGLDLINSSLSWKIDKWTTNDIPANN